MSTPFGHIYERSALLQRMARNGNRDPKAKKILKVEDLRPDKTTKALADRFRKSNIV